MSLWHRLGFTENPYFTTPIQVDEAGLGLFVGRGNEVRRLVNKWDEKERAITVVGGNIGTGKTSFLNVCQYLCLTGRRDFELPYDRRLLRAAPTEVASAPTGSGAAAVAAPHQPCPAGEGHRSNLRPRSNDTSGPAAPGARIP